MSNPVLNAAVPVLPVAEIQKACTFYRDRLGFLIDHAEEGYAVLHRDGVEIHLWCASDESWKDRKASPVESGAESFLAGTASCRVLVTNIDAFHDEMEKSGVVHPNGHLGDKHYGLREFAVLDRDGNLITFFSPLGSKAGHWWTWEFQG